MQLRRDLFKIYNYLPWVGRILSKNLVCLSDISFFSKRHKHKITIIQINVSLFKISTVLYHKSFKVFFLNLGPKEGKFYTFLMVIGIL